MPEQGEQDIVSIAAELSEKRDELREAQKVAGRVPALEAEVRHAKDERDKFIEKARESAKHAGELEKQLRELESKLRSQDEVEAERDAAVDRAADKAKEAGEAHENAVFHEAIVDSQQEKIAAQQNEIERLREYERAVRLRLEAHDLARSLG